MSGIFSKLDIFNCLSPKWSGQIESWPVPPPAVQCNEIRCGTRYRQSIRLETTPPKSVQVAGSAFVHLSSQALNRSFSSSTRSAQNSLSFQTALRMLSGAVGMCGRMSSLGSA